MLILPFLIRAMLSIAVYGEMDIPLSLGVLYCFRNNRNTREGVKLAHMLLSKVMSRSHLFDARSNFGFGCFNCVVIVFFFYFPTAR